MEAATTTHPARRRRRSPEEAEHEIIAAAEALLRERPFRELTVDEVMRRTGLSRPSFYVYFKDRHHLVLRVVEHIGGELFTMSNRWFKGAEPGPQAVRAALEGVAGVYELHGPVLKALSDAAADDPDVERVYCDLVEGFVGASAKHIEGEIAAGRVRPMDPRHAAEALIWMNERFLNTHLGREPKAPTAMVVDTLAAIWTRTLYGV
jgi:TetR/AcrR family transcriptional regulator, ethionamide resistance regulator